MSRKYFSCHMHFKDTITGFNDLKNLLCGIPEKILYYICVHVSYQDLTWEKIDEDITKESGNQCCLQKLNLSI